MATWNDQAQFAGIATRDLLSEWLKPGRRPRLAGAGEIGVNPDQRIHEDARRLQALASARRARVPVTRAGPRRDPRTSSGGQRPQQHIARSDIGEVIIDGVARPLHSTVSYHSMAVDQRSLNSRTAIGLHSWCGPSPRGLEKSEIALILQRERRSQEACGRRARLSPDGAGCARDSDLTESIPSDGAKKSRDCGNKTDAGAVKSV